MTFLTITLGLLFTITLIHILQLLSTRGKKLPPGPTPLPIIGNLHLLGDQPHQSLSLLAKTYGPLMFLRLGQRSTVVISSSTMAREILQKQDLTFSSRNIQDAVHAHNHFKYSVVFLPVTSSRWRSLRKIMNSHIFSGTCLEAKQDLRRRKVHELVEYCRKTSQIGEAVDVGRAALRTTLNFLSNTIFSRDLTDPTSDSAKEFKDIVRDIMIETGKPNLADYFPFLNRVDPQGIRGRTSVHFGKLKELFGGLIDERLEKQKNLHDEENDVLDALLRASQESPEEVDRIHIEHLFMDMFVAGTDTTSSTLEWAMAEALTNPETMRKAKAELEEVIGKGKVIDEQDISRLPYLQCMVKETLRLHPSVPFLIPRRVDQDIEVCGYIVPNSSQVLVNAWAIGRDEAVWENPLEFRPERFLGSEVDVKGLDFELIPFGTGRRICPGLPLAIRMVPVMLGSLLNSFDWKAEGGLRPEELDMEEKFGITLQKAHPLRVVPIPL